MGGESFEESVNRFDEALKKFRDEEIKFRIIHKSDLNHDDHYLMLSYELIKYAGRIDLLNRFRETDQSMSEGTTLKSKLFSSWFFRIAALAFLAFLIGQIFTPVREDGSINVFEQFFEPYVNVAYGTYRSTDEKNALQDDEIRLLKRKAYHAYDKADYRQCILDFEKIPEDKKTLADYFFAGNAYLAMGDAVSAIAIFEKLKEVDDVFKNQSLWYLGLAYLKSGEKKYAIEVFEELKSSKSVYSNKSREILNYLEKSF
ncbi:MAG: hypothetical protein JJU28_23500 [Cyclobacteriaceae bacterium]|nr:hypothetical protein [Cyclobacteriaceae bacterium]